MIGISKLCCGVIRPVDHLRYGKDAHQKPVVVWNSTRRCNLNCIHCYAQSSNKIYPNELTTEEAKTFIKDLADYGVPVLLFSGGEPLLRHDLVKLAKFTSDSGIRCVISTNGTLITTSAAQKLKTAGLSYVGVSIDGMSETNDIFRGVQGAFELARTGIRNSVKAGIKTGLRFTVTKYNFKDVPAIFDFIESENISRVCFYHLVYAGRGSNMVENDLSHTQTRDFMDYLLKKAEELNDKGIDTEILTVDNHADGPYVYMKLKETDEKKAEEALQLLRVNGGNSSGEGIACVDFNGYVHPDQFWRHHSLGNIRDRKFSEIWKGETDPLLKALRQRKTLVKGRCTACQFLDICNGNFRVRADAVYGDIWMPDPACYLTDMEITAK
jgi:radical SAM protein with 4Fe4S-binding SPASM domain